MDKIQLEILRLAEGVSNSNTFTVVLGEKSGARRLIIVIGFAEAQAIAVSMDNIKLSRPLTHDLTHNICTIFNIDLIEVVITELREGIYYSVLVCKKGDFVVEIDSRTSDAIALAVRFECPIYIKKNVLEAEGTLWKEDAEQTIEEFEEELEDELKEMAEIAIEELELEDYSKNTITELEEMMENALSNEDYELAVRLRDEINKRK